MTLQDANLYCLFDIAKYVKYEEVKAFKVSWEEN